MTVAVSGVPGNIVLARSFLAVNKLPYFPTDNVIDGQPHSRRLTETVCNRRGWIEGIRVVQERRLRVHGHR